MRKNEERTVGAEELIVMDEYLRGYAFQRKLLQLTRYEQTYFCGGRLVEELSPEVPLARARMFEVRHFVMGLPNGDGKLLLYYHYIQGHTVERCAELLGISRASGYRLKKKALTLAVLQQERQGV